MMLRRRDLLTLSIIIMNEILEPDEMSNQLLDLVDYGSEWQGAMKKLTANMNDPIFNKHVVKTILNKYMWSCPTDELEEKILSVVCPFLKQSVFEIVDDIEKQLDDLEVMKNAEPTTFDGQFIEIKNLLARWQEIVKHAAQIQITPSCIKSLLEYLPSVVIKVCSHCKDNRKKYLKRTLPLLLQDIYRDVCSIVKNYCALFLNSFKFNLESDPHLNTLKQVITGLGDMAPYTAYGMSTMIQTWKTFKYMACVISSEAYKKKDFVDLVRGYFKSIGKNIIKLFKQIMMRPETEFVTRAKCSNLLLDIFSELHAFYCTKLCPFPLEPEFIRDMVHMLIEFTGHYELCLASNLDGGKSWHRDQIFKTAWAKTLHNFYNKSDHYLTEFRAQSKEIKNRNDPDYALGFHYCLLHYHIFSKEEILDMTLENINYIQVEIMEKLTQVLNWGTGEGGMREASIYEYTLAMLCSICNFALDAEIFSVCEDIILKHLLGERYWSSLLAYDILIHCYACSNKDVAFTHIQYFMTAYETLHERENDSLAVTMLRTLILDICELLPNNKINELLDKCESPTSLLLILKSDHVKGSHAKILNTYKQLSCTGLSSSLPRAMGNLEQQPSAKNWKQLINQLTVIGLGRDKDNDRWTEDLLEITSYALQTAKELDESNKQRMMYDLILKLFDCARFQDVKCGTNVFNWPLFWALSEGLLELTDAPESFLIKVCHYLTANVDCLVGLYDDAEITLMASVFIHLLESKSQFVHEEALECFETIVEKVNEAFVRAISNAIAKRPKLCEAVPAYLKKKPFPMLPNDNCMPKGWHNYVTLASQFNELSMKHNCRKNDERVRDEKMPKLYEESLEERIIRLANELTILSRENINHTPVAAERLRNVCRLFIES